MSIGQFPPMMRPTWLMAPTVIPDAALIGAISRCAGWEPWRCLWPLRADPEVSRD